MLFDSELLEQPISENDSDINKTETIGLRLFMFFGFTSFPSI